MRFPQSCIDGGRGVAKEKNEIHNSKGFFFVFRQLLGMIPSIRSLFYSSIPMSTGVCQRKDPDSVWGGAGHTQTQTSWFGVTLSCDAVLRMSSFDGIHQPLIPCRPKTILQLPRLQDQNLTNDHGSKRWQKVKKGRAWAFCPHGGGVVLCTTILVSESN